jgi:hypothetical protein
MKKQNEIVPRKRLTLEEQFMNLATALNSATAQSNTQVMNALAIYLKAYEVKIAEQNQQSK